MIVTGMQLALSPIAFRLRIMGMIAYPVEFMCIAEEIPTCTTHMVLPNIMLSQPERRRSKPIAWLAVQVVIIQMKLESSKSRQILLEATEIAKMVIQ